MRRFAFIKAAVVILAVVFPLLPSAGAAEPDRLTPAQVEFFEMKVRPLLAGKCFKCHGSKKHKGRLRLDSRTALLTGGDSGSAIEPGKPEKSLLIEAVNYEGLEMPPTGKLKPREIAILTKWVKTGALWPDSKGVRRKSSSADPHEITEDDRNYWAFQPVARPTLPTLKHKQILANPIDAFVLARLETQDLKPNPPADKRTLIRRLYFDLIGLPPSPEQVDAFVASEVPEAYEKLVDDLLGRTQYGERWGRYWLDVVRFAQTNGYERDNEKENAWRYRDYVISAFNHDKPYDRFIIEQLAGDELDDVSHETIIATGFYRLGVWDDEPDDQKQAQFNEYDEIIRTTGSAFLGMTFGCARCHSHKFDPFPQEDYYRLLAFFRNIEHIGISSSAKHFQLNSQGIFTPLTDAADVASWREKQDILRVKIAELRKEVDQLRAPVRKAIFEKRLAALPDDLQKAYRTPKKKRTDELAKKAEEAEKKATPNEKEIDEKLPEPARAEKKKLDEAIKKQNETLNKEPFRKALSVRSTGMSHKETFVLIRGTASTPGKKVSPQFPLIFGGKVPRLSAQPSSGNPSAYRRTLAKLGLKPTPRLRLALAEWIADGTNPLTARVMVNRLWQHHFGRGIVRSTNNFGKTGFPPTHPKLLDWLAAEFVSGGWKIKRMHKLIVMSDTYRMSSRADNRKGMAVDPGNEFFWRQNMRRLDAEAVRDSILSVSGRLNLKLGGRGFFPLLSKDVLATQSRPGAGWGQSDDAERARRSVYIYVKRTLMVPILEAFDYTNTAESLGVRPVTTVAPQALLLLNSQFLNQQTGHMADRLLKEAGNNENAQIERAFRLTLLRGPSDDEKEIAKKLLHEQQKRLKPGANPDKKSERKTNHLALRSLCLVLLNLNEFVYVD